jgi:tetratricopeptide (TPR) repeat protein
VQNPISIPATGRGIFYFLICLLSGAFSSMMLCAQTAKARTDSLARVRQQRQDSSRTALEASRIRQKARIDSTRAAQQKTLENLRATRQHALDSMKASRKKVTDSLVAIRKYRESKRYKDSVVRSRTQKVELVRTNQKQKFDSLKAIRQRSTDSAIAVRKRSTDSLKKIQKVRTDSLTAIRKYRESKRYKDSVTIVRKARMDELAKTRKAYNDSMFAIRKAVIDSSRAMRKHLSDSATAVRTKNLDSLKAIRKVRADSLAKAKEAREKTQKVKEKQKESLANMKFELKLKQKRSVYSNTKMLKKKWSLPRQVVQNTFTRYNYYFNAERKMEEAKANMQRLAKDDYNKPIALFSFDPNRDSTLLASDMDSVIQKVSLGIQIHDPRTKWGDDLYLLLGQAYFYKGDYNNAEASFRYIVAQHAKEKREREKKAAEKRGYARKKEEPSLVEEEKNSLLSFLKHETVNNDALLWVARTYTQARKYDEAASVLDLLSSDSRFPESLRGRLALEFAFLNLSQGNNKDASKQLAIVASDKSQEFFIRRRAAFLAGQLFEQNGNYTAAAAEYDKVTRLLPKIDMDFHARRSRAYNLMLAGGSPSEAIASLKSMLKDSKYVAYNEQIYYMLGRLSVTANNPKDAENYLLKSVASEKTTKSQKASSFAALGNVYYNAGNWEGAKSSYDSATRLASYAPDDTSVIVAARRSKVLDRVAGPARTITVQDSLMAMAAMTEKEQRNIARRYIRSLEQRRADSALRVENASNSPQQGQEVEATPGSMSFYFSNPTLTQQGLIDFKRKWGNRPAADNWRLAAASGLAGSNVTNANSTPTFTGGGNTAPGAGLDENGLPTEESLLAGIPSNQAQKDEAARKIQRAYVDLGNAYVTNLEDYQRAGTVLDKLDSRYPTHPYSDEELYIRYLTALRQNNLTQAKIYSDRLLKDYNSSKWADNVRPSGNKEDGGLLTASTGTVADYYDETYRLLMQRQYEEVLSRSRTGKQRYKEETYNNRFQIMEAIAFAGSGNYKQADTLLSEFIRTHPTDSLRSWADNVMKYVQGQKKADTLNRQPTTVQLATTNASAPAITPTPGNMPVAQSAVPPSSTAMANLPVAYTYKPAEEHYFIFYVKNKDNKAMGLKAGLTDFNTMKYGGAQLTNTMEMLVGNEGMVVVKKFKNAAAAKGYLAEFKKTQILTREFSNGQYQVFVISSSNYLKLTTDRAIQPYLTFYRSKY